LQRFKVSNQNKKTPNNLRVSNNMIDKIYKGHRYRYHEVTDDYS